ncbi:tail fiber assembly protein [Enterobacteriaceae bacterium YMB-R22]|uniref:tail fiber assembly protein n=1 Tax=Tenebrionicola larvae TaxID=2815733 RepID=UPI0020119875|nr:tail fiber assembly protein [Tenebrionicola larvae]MBV4412891.1 tail fiber assembly protein [Tenebrionicola larvae]
MAEAMLNHNGTATQAGDITVYNYDGMTREYLSTTVEYLVVGVGIPANASTDKPLKAKKGFAVCRTSDLTTWEYVVDHRGEAVYDTSTGQPVEVTAPGEYADGVTLLAPSTPYDVWNGSAWVTDEAAQAAGQKHAAEQERAALLAEAQSTISLWQTELQLGIISDDNKASLIAWITYIQALQAVDISTAPDIDWPVKPE